MKKIIWLMLSLFLLLGLMGVSYADDAGYYLIDSVSDGEVTMGRDDLVAFGLEWYIWLQEEGVAHIQFDDLVIGAWADGVISATVDDITEELPYTIEGDALTIDLGGESAVFLRSEEAPPETALSPAGEKGSPESTVDGQPEVPGAEVKGDPVGYYLIDSISDGEVTMGRDDLVAFGLEWYIWLQEEGVAHIQFDDLVIGAWADGVISATVDDITEELPYTIEGDALTIDLGGESAVFLRSEEALPETSLSSVGEKGSPESIGDGQPEVPGAEVKGDPVGYYLIDSVSDGEVTMGRDDLVAFGLEWYIWLQEEGVAHIQFDDLVIGTWVDGVIAATVDDITEELPYTIEGDALTIDLGGESATFLRSEEAPPPETNFPQEPVKPQEPADPREDEKEEDEDAGEKGTGDAEPPETEAATAPPEAPVTEALTPLQQWWAGDWYGYWTISGVTDRYEELDDGSWDCYGKITLAEDGSGTIHLWDGEGTLFTVDVSVSGGGGSGAMGAAVSNEGSYRDGAEIGRADMIIDPSLYGYDHYIVIDSYYESADDSDEGYYYWVYLRPWGQLWEDIPEDSRPPQYSDWYLERHNLPFAEALNMSATSGDNAADPEGTAKKEEPEPVPARSLFANCPEGWQTYTPQLMDDELETIPPGLELRKGVAKADDRYEMPGMVIMYYADERHFTVPVKVPFQESGTPTSLEIGGRTWQCLTGTWNGSDVALLLTDDDTDETIAVMVWLTKFGGNISLEDADVVEIIASIGK